MLPELGFMGQLTTRNVLDDIDFALRNGFDWFELDIDWEQNYNIDKKTISEIIKRTKNKLKLIIHTAWYLPTSSMIPEIKKALISYMAKAIKLAVKTGADRITIHPGFREMPGPAVILSYESLVENLKEIVSIASRHKINICLENFDKNSYLLGYKSKDYLNVLNSVKGLKTTLDIGHSNTTETKPVEFLDLVKSTIMDMHVHDNNGEYDEHKLIGTGNVDLKGVIMKCKEIGYKGPFTLELFPYETILAGKKKFESLWNEN